MKLKYYLFFAFIALNSLNAAIFTVTNAKDSGKGSLRQAIIDNNETPGLNTIVFDISQKETLRIHPGSELDAITNPVAIDGRLRVEINGKGIGDGTRTGFGLRLMKGSSGSTIKGLVLNEWPLAGILLEKSSDHTIEGNYIGTDLPGLRAKGNGTAGILLMDSSNNKVNSNVISGNERHGIKIARSAGNVMQSNLIGLNANGKKLPNMGSGIKITASSNNIVGGFDLSQGNEIAYNGIYGVEIGETLSDFDAEHNAILCNSIYGNKSIGITFHQQTIHDTLGPNNLQARPEITSIKCTQSSTKIEGFLSSLDDQTFEIQFFSTASSGLGQGKTFLGSVTITTDTFGFATFNFKCGAVGRDTYITATSTQLDVQETSPFSYPVKGK